MSYLIRHSAITEHRTAADLLPSKDEQNGCVERGARCGVLPQAGRHRSTRL